VLAAGGVVAAGGALGGAVVAAGVSDGGAELGAFVIRMVDVGEAVVDALAPGDGLVDVGRTCARWFPR
jgi:hypothetical protein